MMTRVPLACLTLTSLAALAGPATGQGQPAKLPSVLEESLAYYAMLTSYSDTGTTRQEVPGIVDEAKFTTYFRRPTRDLYFDFQALTSTNPTNKFTIDMSAQRLIIWMAGGVMQQYDFKSRALEQKPQQVQALQTAGHLTTGASMLIPSLLYAKTDVPGTVRQIKSARVEGTEPVDGHPCHKLVGIAAQQLGNGRQVNERPVTVWIDAESKLVRRVFEDTPAGYPASTYLRLTTTLQPKANPSIDEDRFRFTPPQR
jgi:outer membrane lipoprotein-sorting protein